MLFKENNLKSTDHCIHSLDEEALSRKHRGEHLSEGNNRLKDLLDGKLSPQEIADDPVLASLAERIYGADFIEHIGISRGHHASLLSQMLSEKFITTQILSNMFFYCEIFVVTLLYHCAKVNTNHT